MNETRMTNKELFWLYLKVGGSAFGGWPTTARLLERSLVDERKLVSKRQLDSAIVSGQLLPGPAQVILAAQVAYFIRGRGGVAVAMIAYLLPSIAVTFLFSFIYFNFLRGSDFTKHTLGLQAAVAGIILGNAFHMGQRHATQPWLWLAVGVACLAKLVFGIPVLLILLVAACLGLFVVPMFGGKLHA